MHAKSLLISLAPWVLFSLVAERVGADHVTVAAGVACLAALALTGYEASRNSWKILDIAGVLTFGAIATVGLLGNHQVDEGLVDFGRGGSTFVLAAVMAVSVFTVPFTEQYARETVDRSMWRSPIFRAKNRSISSMWAGVMFVVALSHILAGFLAASSGLPGSHPGNVLLNWVIPIGLIIFAIKRTRVVADAPVSPSAPYYTH